MTTIQEEIVWERSMIDRGIERFKQQRDRAIEGDRAAETSSGQRLLQSYIQQISDALKEYLNNKGPTRRAPEAKVMSAMDTDKVAYIALKQMLGCVYTVDRVYQSVCAEVGSKIEDELHLMELELHHKPYFDQAMRQIESKQTSNYKYIRNSILLAAKNNTDWKPDYWTHHQRCLIGLLVTRLVMQCCDLFETRIGYRANQTASWGKYEDTFLIPTDECLTWVQEHDEAMALLFPDRMPMLMKPDDWSGPRDGGYVLAELRHTTPMIIRSRFNPQAGLDRYERADMPRFYRGLNKIQSTPWRINQRVLAVMREVWARNLAVGMPRAEPYEFPPCPLDPGAKPETPDQEEAFHKWKADTRVLHTKEAERSALCMLVMRNLRIAKELEDKKEFYFVHRADFRGRIYAASTGVSPQGPDQSKALLEFGVAKPLGENGWYWLRVHGANKYGNDKVSYDERVQWVDANRERWLQVAADPIGYRSTWADADKPYQFLAWCFEYADANAFGAAFKSRLPVALDGSCNGLQHFSAMLRDQVGGAAVNLTSTAKPADIYQEVANVATKRLIELAQSGGDLEAGARNWLRLFKKMSPDNPRMPRKGAKRPVMTLPYGSTQNTCTESIYDWYREADGNFFGNTGFQHAIYLSPVLWQSIGEVVIAARAAMSWIQKCAGIVAKSGKPLSYTTPIGFPVHQSSPKTENVRIFTRINGAIRLRINCATHEQDSRKIRQGSSPNFVHATDATHLCMTVCAANDEGIDNFAMIHDDFGTHACHIDAFHRIIREQFVALHSTNVLEAFRSELEARYDVSLPPCPPTGTLNLQGILDSPYFFG